MADETLALSRRPGRERRSRLDVILPRLPARIRLAAIVFNKVVLSSLLALSIALTRSYAAVAPAVDARTQEQAEEIVQSAMYFYWNGGDIKKVEETFFKGITLRGRIDVVEQGFRAASKLLPERLDYRFGIASSQIAQGRFAEALATYDEIAAMGPDGFMAPILSAAYLRALGETAKSESVLERLDTIDRRRTRAYREKFERTDKIIGMTIHFEPPTTVPAGRTAVVVLGYALAKDGTMQPTLIHRLEKTLALAQAMPDAVFILTGGVQRAGVTESYLMKRWLQERGVKPERLVIEDQAKDTVGNVLYSAALLEPFGVAHVVLVTSGTHMRRAMALLQEAVSDRGLDVTYGDLAENDFTKGEQKVTARERAMIYRDLMRTSGIWAYPGIQQ